MFTTYKYKQFPANVASYDLARFISFIYLVMSSILINLVLKLIK